MNLEKLKNKLKLNDEAQIAPIFYFIMMIAFGGMLLIITQGYAYYITEVDIGLASVIPQSREHIDSMIFLQQAIKALGIIIVILALVYVIKGSLRENSGYE